ncbi:class I SAM-dependent methyltransferase, partial [Rhodobaculum claviforme]
MHLDVMELRDFYYRTGLGRAVQRAVRGQMLSLWPSAAGMTVAGYGFAQPLLRPYLGQARRVIGLMPAQQGVMPWPAGMPNVSVLCEEGRWPLNAGSVDRLVLLHGLETSDHQTYVLREAHRVLADGGRALFVVPNRRGLWAQRDATPFGQGRTYSLGQIEALVRGYDFVPERHLAALYAPPAGRGFWLRTSDFWEGVG